MRYVFWGLGIAGYVLLGFLLCGHALSRPEPAQEQRKNVQLARKELERSLTALQGCNAHLIPPPWHLDNAYRILRRTMRGHEVHAFEAGKSVKQLPSASQEQVRSWQQAQLGPLALQVHEELWKLAGKTVLVADPASVDQKLQAVKELFKQLVLSTDTAQARKIDAIYHPRLTAVYQEKMKRPLSW